MPPTSLATVFEAHKARSNRKSPHVSSVLGWGRMWLFTAVICIDVPAHANEDCACFPPEPLQDYRCYGNVSQDGTLNNQDCVHPGIASDGSETTFDPAWNIWCYRYTYDAENRLSLVVMRIVSYDDYLRVDLPPTATWRFSYDDDGLLIAITRVIEDGTEQRCVVTPCRAEAVLTGDCEARCESRADRD